MAQEYLPVARQEAAGKDGWAVQGQALVGIVPGARQAQTGPAAPGR